MEEIKTAFNMFDENGDQTIDQRELKRIMLTLGVEATTVEVAELMKQADKDGNGYIDYEEFITLMKDKMVFAEPLSAV